MSSPTTTPLADSIAYRAELARMVGAKRDTNIARIATAFLADKRFAPTEPDRGDLARKLARMAVAALMGNAT